MATSEQTLSGWQGRPLPLRWQRPDTPGEIIAILWPGLRYTCDRPLLAQATDLLLRRGVGVAQVWADYQTPDFQQAPPDRRWRWLVAEALTVIQAVRREAQPRRLVWVGKSLGTLAMAGAWLEGQGRDLAASVWLTPLLAFPAVVKVLANLDTRALMVGSREDPTFDQDGWRRAAANMQVEPLLLDRGNHSLEVPHDIQATQQNLEQVTRRMEEFFDQTLT